MNNNSSSNNHSQSTQLDPDYDDIMLLLQNVSLDTLNQLGTAISIRQQAITQNNLNSQTNNKMQVRENNILKKVCRFYKKGSISSCKFGYECSFIHSDVINYQLQFQKDKLNSQISAFNLMQNNLSLSSKNAINSNTDLSFMQLSDQFTPSFNNLSQLDMQIKNTNSQLRSDMISNNLPLAQANNQKIMSKIINTNTDQNEHDTINNSDDLYLIDQKSKIPDSSILIFSPAKKVSAAQVEIQQQKQQQCQQNIMDHVTINHNPVKEHNIQNRSAVSMVQKNELRPNINNTQQVKPTLQHFDQKKQVQQLDLDTTNKDNQPLQHQVQQTPQELAVNSLKQCLTTIFSPQNANNVFQQIPTQTINSSNTYNLNRQMPYLNKINKTIPTTEQQDIEERKTIRETCIRLKDQQREKVRKKTNEEILEIKRRNMAKAREARVNKGQIKQQDMVEEIKNNLDQHQEVAENFENTEQPIIESSAKCINSPVTNQYAFEPIDTLQSGDPHYYLSEQYDDYSQDKDQFDNNDFDYQYDEVNEDDEDDFSCQNNDI